MASLFRSNALGQVPPTPEKLSELKTNLLTYADKNVLNELDSYILSPTNDRRDNLIRTVRSELKMGSDVANETFNRIIDYKPSNHREVQVK